MITDLIIRFAQETLEVLDEEPYSDLDDIEELLEDIDRRRQDRNLNVAVIGEFSTGKSTFINAFINRNILKTAWSATTAVPTYILFHAGEQVKIIVTDCRRREYEPMDAYGREKLERYLDESLPDDAENLLARITTTDAWTQKLSMVKVYVPETTMPDNICIIDTPGVNPGEEGTQKHVEATQRVLRDYADTAIVLFPAQAVYTGSFQKFLKANAEHFMHNAVFVITMKDLVCEEEWEDVAAYAAENLRDGFGIAHPVIYSCSAKYAAPGKKRKASDAHWKEEFDALRETILERMKAERTQIIEDKMDLLMRRLMEELEEEMLRSREYLKKTLDRITAISQKQLQDDPEGFEASLHSFNRERRNLEGRISRVENLYRQMENYLECMGT